MATADLPVERIETESKPAAGCDLLKFRPIRRLVRWAGFPYVFQALMLIAFVTLAILGWGHLTPQGVPDKLYAKSNLVNLVIWGLFWPSMIWLAVLFGRVWCAVCQDRRGSGRLRKSLGHLRSKSVHSARLTVRIRIFQRPDGPPAIILVRLLVGAVFLSEGVQKFLFPGQLGVGRFTKIGIPIPEIMAPFVGRVEIICGGLVLLGLFTRMAVIPLIIDMFVAIASTKIPILLERGVWAMAHETRTDYSMLLGWIFLLIVGPGRWSVDARLGGGLR